MGHWLGPHGLRGVLPGHPLLLGEDHGTPSSHFWHAAPFRNGRRVLFHDSSRRGMLHSNLDLVLMLLALAAHHTSLARVLAVYGLPDLVINAWRGTALLSRQYPELVRLDPTPIHRVLWRIASGCALVSQEGSGAGFYYQAPFAATEPSP